MDIGEAIRSAIASEAGDEIVTGWVAVVEVMTTEGHRYLARYIDPADAPAWQIDGWLQHAIDWPEEEDE